MRAALLLVLATTAWSATAVGDDRGRRIYDFHCYQCHGYGGDARTVAAAAVAPPPRDFTAADGRTLTRALMIDAVTHGRGGTAMVSYATVLSTAEIAAVVDFIRAEFMRGTPSRRLYHTAANGWPDHDRYRAAFPYVLGTRPVSAEDTAGPVAREGLRLYRTACSTCHDRDMPGSAPPVWALRPVSFPRNRYDHRAPDVVLGASPYLRETVPEEGPDDPGRSLFLSNCAFCHADDGSGRNWIGSFLEPGARDLRAYVARGADADALRAVVTDGLSGTAMPAWRHVLTAAQIDVVVGYLLRTFAQPGENVARDDLRSDQPDVPEMDRAVAAHDQ